VGIVAQLTGVSVDRSVEGDGGCGRCVCAL